MRKHSRRGVLRTVGGASAAFAFNILPAWGKTPPSEQIRLGLVGLANQGTNHLKQLDSHVVALCDVDAGHLARAEKLLESRTGRRPVASASDYRTLLDRKDIDALVITTPDHWHALSTIEACMAGKDVYVEKPLSLFIDEGKAMTAAARKYGRVVQTGSQQRSSKLFRRAVVIVRSRRLGKIREVRVGLPGVSFKGIEGPETPPPSELDYDRWLGPAPSRPYHKDRVHYIFRFFRDYSGGQMTNWGAHHLDIVQWALSADESGPTRIEGTATHDPEKRFEVPASSKVTFTYADGTIVHCEQGDTDWKGGVEFLGENGSFFVSREELRVDPPTLLHPVMAPHLFGVETSNDHYANWLDAIKSRARPICDVAVGHRSASVCHLANIACRLGRPLEWDPRAEQFVYDSEAQAFLSRPYRSPYRLPEIPA